MSASKDFLHPYCIASFVRVLLFGQQLAAFRKLRFTRIGHNHVILEVDRPFSRLVVFMSSRLPRRLGMALEKPDVHDRCSQLDMPHALAAYATE